MSASSLNGNREISWLAIGPLGRMVRDGKARSRSRRCTTKADLAIVSWEAAEQSRDPGGGGGRAKGEDQRGTRTSKARSRTQSRARVIQALGRVRQAPERRFAVTHRGPAGCSNRARPDLCGGRPAMDVPTANLGRLDPFPAPFGYDRYLREADGKCDVKGRSRPPSGRLNWAESGPTRFALQGLESARKWSKGYNFRSGVRVSGPNELDFGVFVTLWSVCAS